MNLQLTDEQVESILKELRSKGVATNNWDINLAEGVFKENVLANMLKTVEVKTDYRVSDTGNVAIEISHGGKESGIMATKSDWWAIVLEGTDYNGDIVVIIRTDRLKELIAPAVEVGQTVFGGDNKKSEMVILPVERLLE